MTILDFKEISKSQPGEALEALVREIGHSLGLSPDWSGRGADQGRDLFFTEFRKGPVGSTTVKWLVNCKDFAQSGRSATEADVGTVLEKLAQHGAQGFLFVTTTTASTALKSMLDGVHAAGKAETLVWDRHELERILLRDVHPDIAKRFMPNSYTKWKKPNSLSEVIDNLIVFLPPIVFERVKSVIDTYKDGETWITGLHIWPHDIASAETIDNALEALFSADATKAARVLIDEGIEYEAFESLLENLASVHPEQTKSLCRELILAHERDGMSYNAYRFLVDHFEPSSDEHIKLAVELSDEELCELFSDEVAVYINDTISSQATEYSGWSEIDSLSSHTMIEEAYTTDVSITANIQEARIEFEASLTLSLTLTYDREAKSNISLPGRATGIIDAHGMHLTDFTVDTAKFFE